ncbi:serine proteinase stubble-like protein [Leptotrombidium deliense]|uniref:Serine proteinase stubble-like protein n=1 Tax=Leptotrombidium deliense TaxID=299467 RepID=A0A443S3H3_9ACAR|nr:serine proteinase stubble-like protein [Leptotrombidium deliense]
MFLSVQQTNNRIEQKFKNRNQFKWIVDDEDEPWVWGGSEQQGKKHDSNDEAKAEQQPNTKKHNKECGTSPAVKIHERIVGGREAYIGEFPWQVAITRKVFTGYVFHCGGAILNGNWIVTAAHCIIL